MTLATRALAVLLTCSAFLVLDTPEAQAHDRLKRSSPAKGATVKALETIELEFTSRVRLPAIVLHDADGRAVKVGKPRTAGDTVTARVPGSPAAGRYVIGWRVLSGDGHPMEGEITFRVKAHAAPTPTASATLPASTTPQPTSQPASQPVSEAGGQGASAWPWTAGGLLVVAGAGFWLVRRHRGRAGTEDGP